MCMWFSCRQSNRLVEYQDYYRNTEILLDSIDAWYPNFTDSIMETEAYYNYETYRNIIVKK